MLNCEVPFIKFIKIQYVPVGHKRIDLSLIFADLPKGQYSVGMHGCSE